MQFDHKTYADAIMADFAREAANAYRVSQARNPGNIPAEKTPGWVSRFMMSLGLRTPTMQHAGI